MTEAELVEAFPEVNWFEPVSLSVIGMMRGGYVCRFCVAMRGFGINKDIEHISTYDAVKRHIERDHRS